MSSYTIDSLFGVRGKVAVVTGGGSGLGYAIAQGFAVNGARVFITGRRAQVLEQAAAAINAAAGKQAVTAVQGDISTKAGCAALAEAVSKLTDRVDVLVNNAGVLVPFRHYAKNVDDPDFIQKQLWSPLDDDFTNTFATNVSGPYFGTVAFLSLLRKSANPSVVVIASIAHQGVSRITSSTSYAASKAGALMVGKQLAGRLGPMGIRVNVVSPGIFPSEMSGNPQKHGAFKMDKAAALGAARSLMGRAGKPEEIVGPVLLFAGKGGGYLTGADLMVDGGRSISAGVNDGIQLPDDLYLIKYDRNNAKL